MEKLIRVMMLITIILIACEKIKDEDVTPVDESQEFIKRECPECDENVTFEGYGNLKFSTAGWDGDLDSVYGGLNIEKDCGWEIFHNFDGGWGSTYRVFSPSCDTSVVLIWMWGDFNGLALRKNWEGYLNDPSDSIKMGCSLEHFLKIYPDYKPDRGGHVYQNPFLSGDNDFYYEYYCFFDKYHSYVGFSQKEKKMEWFYYFRISL